MDLAFRDHFTEQWKRYFKNAELPLVFFYSKDLQGVELSPKPKGHSCLICGLKKVRNGTSMAFGEHNIGCGGGSHYAGFTQKIREDFEYFLSCGKMGTEGERYKQDPETVRLMMEDFPALRKQDQWLIFKRWDQLTEQDEPEVAVFFARPDVLSGLFMLANFDFIGHAGVITPFSSGCGSIILHPYQEKDKDKPRSIIGMFDPSARPCVKDDELTFATPFNRLKQLSEYMDESFLITDTWKTMHKRLD
ncbi:MAG TPA: DUF169 domain-containing protein [Bacteroidales bacterium]|nr:DUF169 domain-containing protein [Bacteroidales bacterium]